jgi:hypothetical protein
MLQTVFTALVQLDPKLQQLIALAVTALVSFLILQVAKSYPWLGDYLGDHKVAIVTWLTGIIVQILQAQLDKVPATWNTVLTLVMQLIVSIAVIFVGFAFYAKHEVRGAQALR